MVTLKLSPAEVASQLSHLPGLVFIDSSGNLSDLDDNPISIITVDPVKIIKGNHMDFSEIRLATAGYEFICDEVTENEIAGLPYGGAFGWIDYDGEFCFGIYESCLIYAHERKQWYEVGNVISRLRASPEVNFRVSGFCSHTTKDEYIKGVEKIKEYINSGDIYQVNLTQKFSAEVKSGFMFSLYDSLRQVAPAPMSAYINLSDREVLSSSPETFLKMCGKHIETKPIKGTRPRYDDALKDETSAQDLLDSVKEKSELIMITDLERNDLGKVCEYGTVNVDTMLQLEKLEHVYHLVSKVSGILRDDVDHWQAVHECFPGGSITGAPKKRAMEIIEELEKEKRGLYTGVIGYVGFNDVSQFNIVIRTLVREGEMLHYHVGAGIVADSDPLAEYEETIHKAKGIRRALAENTKK